MVKVDVVITNSQQLWNGVLAIVKDDMLLFRVNLLLLTALEAGVEVEADHWCDGAEAFHLREELEEIGKACRRQVLLITKVDNLIPVLTTFALDLIAFNLCEKITCEFFHKLSQSLFISHIKILADLEVSGKQVFVKLGIAAKDMNVWEPVLRCIVRIFGHIYANPPNISLSPVTTLNLLIKVCFRTIHELSYTSTPFIFVVEAQDCE